MLEWKAARPGEAMKCPIDNSDLVMSDRQGIEIDYCPKCRGVWLDRGELDKIIERSASDDGPRQSRSDDDARYRSSDDRGYGRQQDYRPRKKKSLLGEIFDF
jgi:Zn-finger nucleic acid-binding protein